jgi:diguanylate cyclase (GGDEF)-like protein
MAITDPLTGLHNRRSFHHLLEQQLAHSRDEGTPLGMLMLDLDHFKAVNDEHGHPVGDVTLQAVARLLTERLGQGDVAARLGGEEFGVLLPGEDNRAAGSTAERLRVAIATGRVECAGATIAMTASIGVVSCPEHGQTVDALIRRADDALYEAKRTGRNRVCGPPPDPAGTVP